MHPAADCPGVSPPQLGGTKGQEDRGTVSGSSSAAGHAAGLGGLLCPVQAGHRVPSAATPGSRGCFQWDLRDRWHLSLFAAMERECLASGARGAAWCWPCCRSGWRTSGWWQACHAPWAALQAMGMGRLDHGMRGMCQAADRAAASCPDATSSSLPALWLQLFVPSSARSRLLSASQAQPGSHQLEVQPPALVSSATGPRGRVCSSSVDLQLTEKGFCFICRS